MSLTKDYDRSGDWVEEHIYTPTESVNNPAIKPTFAAYRALRLTLADSQLANDGQDTETITVEVVDGLEVARGIDPANATVLGYDGDVTISVDGAETTKTLTNGSVSFDATTTKSAESVIEVVAENLTDHPADPDSATIEVVSA